ncbi:protein kinase [Spongiactinospora sp. TRM90649]|uniref:serine/threonine-protein kinase n=1 Tax=Spongiactinospora sp. TRM90649 TaxID=3031114 RepID=UPI0023F7767E|nr:protein kinase [Spongiactinospora sp. TRM90649]MDF5758738.1 protein kinase [Spongiactinospora sp. TRM90649]
MTAPSHAGRYRIEQIIGVGGFASVYLAYDDELRSPVAVKILADNWARRSDVRERFLQEARLLRRADSHWLVQVFDIGELADGRPYFVMTYADRGTLGDRLADRRPAVAETLRTIQRISQGVAVLHSIGVVHRDLKPSNVLFCTRPEGGERVMVADLGIARSTDHLSGLTLPAGSPGYQAPEQLHFDGAPDARADVHGLGALTYHMLTGTVPDRPERRVPPSGLRPEVPPEIDEVVMRALEPDREGRWPDAAAYAAALLTATRAAIPEAALAVEPGDVAPPAPPRPSGDASDGGPEPRGEVPEDDGTRDPAHGTGSDQEVLAVLRPGDVAPAAPEGAGRLPDGERETGDGPEPDGEATPLPDGTRRSAIVRRRLAWAGAALGTMAMIAITLAVFDGARDGALRNGPATRSAGTDTATEVETGAVPPFGDPTGRLLRLDSDIPKEYRALIVGAGTRCELRGLSPTLIAAMLKAESDFDAALSDPSVDEYGIARWTPSVLWHWQPGGLKSPQPTPPITPELSITAMGRFLCGLGPRIVDIPGDPALNLAALYRSGVDPMHRDGGVPKRWRDYVDKVGRYMRDYAPR